MAVGVYQLHHVRPGVIFSNHKDEASVNNVNNVNNVNKVNIDETSENESDDEDNKKESQSIENNPDHWRKLNAAHGEIFKFRVSLWREHLNRLEPVLADPWTEECTRLVPCKKMS